MSIHHPHASVASIRRRLFLLLLQAFGAIVILTVILLLVLFAVFMERDMRSLGATLTAGLPFRAYYVGHGSWDGVEFMSQSGRHGPPPPEFEGAWRHTLLLDTNGRVLLDNGRADTPLHDQPYTIEANDRVTLIEVDGQTVGTVVFKQDANWGSRRLFVDVFWPVAIISAFTGALTLLIGLLLTRRFVTPLADVIAAAQAMADGDLSARVSARGPGDLRGLNESFNRMAETLECNDRERRKLLADVAHELRTPLSVLRGRLEGIVDGIYPADEAHVAPALAETYLLERLVDDLRLLTLAEARQLPFDLKPSALGEIARRVVDLFSAEATEAGIRLETHIAPALPTVTADTQRVEQVIGNLLSNALRYVPGNGEVIVAVQPSAAGGVELSVSDTGPGVSQTDLPHVFDRFWRGEESRAGNGVGLGLAIAKQLIEAQGGTISASQRPEGGLRISFTLP